MPVFVQWKKFNEWCEIRDWEWYEIRDWIVIMLMLFLFFAVLIMLLPQSLGMLFFWMYDLPYVWVVASYIIVLLIMFFIIWKIYAWLELIRMIVIFGVIIAVTEIQFLVVTIGIPITLDVWVVLVMLWYGACGLFELFVLVFLGLGWRHPGWYVKGYTVICFFWDLYCVYNFVYGLRLGIGNPLLFQLASVSSRALPLIPIWYWCYEYEEEMYALRKRGIYRLS